MDISSWKYRQNAFFSVQTEALRLHTSMNLLISCLQKGVGRPCWRLYWASSRKSTAGNGKINNRKLDLLFSFGLLVLFLAENGEGEYRSLPFLASQDSRRLKYCLILFIFQIKCHYLVIGCYTDSRLWASVIDSQEDVTVPEEELSCNDINTDLFKLDERTRLQSKDRSTNAGQHAKRTGMTKNETLN